MNHEQFTQLVLEYQNLIFTICLNIVNNHSDAENIAQETFLSAYSALPDFRGGNVKSWLCRIAANKSIDFKRKQSKYSFEDCEGIEAKAWGGAAPDEILEQKERKERLDKILSSIPDKYSSVIKAFYFGQLAVKEIARQLEIPEKTVETRLYRAKKIIKERWGEYGT